MKKHKVKSKGQSAMEDRLDYDGRVRRDLLTCPDCGNIIGDDDFMVNDTLWEAIAQGTRCLHMKCFEKRLGRQLSGEDFTLCLLNLDSPDVMERCPEIQEFVYEGGMYETA